MKIEVVKGGICAVKGVRAYGIKEGNKGLALIEGKGIAAGMFTINKIKAAPVSFTRKQLEKGEGRIGAIIANSGCANSFTGEKGMMVNMPPEKLQGILNDIPIPAMQQVLKRFSPEKRRKVLKSLSITDLREVLRELSGEDS